VDWTIKIDNFLGDIIMNPFVSWGIAVAIVMAIVLALFWLKGGKEQAEAVGIFFLGWIVGAIAMYIKAKLVYQF
jgi:hypothetical protein